MRWRATSHRKTRRANGCDVFESAVVLSISTACDGVTFPAPVADDEEFAERSAIREFDGGYSRAEAERLARADIALMRPKGCAGSRTQAPDARLTEDSMRDFQ